MTRPDEPPAAESNPRRRPFVRLLPFLLLAGYAAFLAWLTLSPMDTSGTGAQNNYDPFSTIRLALDSESPRKVAQVLGNGLLFLPIGLLVPWSFPRLKLITAAVGACLLSALIEIAQFTWVDGRVFDVDDILLNSGGALLGIMLVTVGRVVRWLFGRR